MKCQKCGHENNEISQYCVKCGNPLTKNSETVSKDNTRLLKIVASMSIILLILAVGFIVYTNSDIFEHDSDDEQTIFEDDKTSVTIDGVNFILPNEGYFKAENNYYFEFSNHTCAVKEVEHYESTDSSRSIMTTELSKEYSGAESYLLNYSTEYWTGLKIQKDDKWFHISMKTANNKDAMELFDWMYEHNTWVNHN